MSLKDDFIQHKTNMVNIMTKYTQDILSYIAKDITTIIKRYMDNYKVGKSNDLTIKLLLDGDNYIHIMKIAENIHEENLYKITKNFNFRTFRYNTNKKVNLIKLNLENYIQYFMPHWNDFIKEHNIVINKDTKKAYYTLEINFDIGIRIDDNIITMRYNDHLNILFRDYVKNELDSVVKYIVENINNKIKNNIVSNNKHYINVMEYLGNSYGYMDFFSSGPVRRWDYICVMCNSKCSIWNTQTKTVGNNQNDAGVILNCASHIYFKQKNMINILKLHNIPTDFKLIDYIYSIKIFIKYIYIEIEKYYNNINITIVQVPNRPDIFNITGEKVYFVGFLIDV